MSKLSNSWRMMKASATVLKLDPELLIFPLLSGVAAVLVTATFIAPFAFVGGGFRCPGGHGRGRRATWGTWWVSSTTWCSTA